MPARMVVGVDAHIDPAERTLFTEIYGKFATSQRADVGIGPYRVLRKYPEYHPERISNTWDFLKNSSRD